MNFELFLKEKQDLKDKMSKFEDSQVHIGDYTYGEFKVLKFRSQTHLNIGKFSSIARDTEFFLGGNHNTDLMTTYPFNTKFSEFSYITEHPLTKGDINIGHDVWIGKACKILSGVTIGNGAVVGCGSVITHDIEPYSIYAGNPARFIKYRFDDETIKILNEIKWWDWADEYIYKAVPILQNYDVLALQDFYNKEVKNK